MCRVSVLLASGNKALYTPDSVLFRRNMNSVVKSSTSIAKFYDGKSVFITGATGFLGKVLLEKLLYSCSGINNVYILTRPKKGLNPKQRVAQLIDSPVFNRLKASRPGVLRKILPIYGELTAPGLGLSNEDKDLLLDKVSVVFHSAATIKFDEPLKVALQTNFEGTKRVLELSKSIRNIRAFVHVSTAYCNTDKEVIEEKVYPPPAQLHEVYEFVEKYGDDENRTKKFLNGHPNTYCFTKSLTEAYLAENCGNVPTVILRPSIVSAALSEPLAGWLDGWQGSTTIIAQSARGFHRVILCDGQGISDMIPVDYVANMALVAAAYPKSHELKVYNCCTSAVNPITWGTVMKLFFDVSKADHFQKMPFPNVVFTHSRVVLSILTLLTHYLPAYVMDGARAVMLKRPKYIRLNRQILNLRNQMQYFAMNSWIMKSPNAQALAASLSKTDAQIFPCHPARIHWPTYMPIYYSGVKKFLFGGKV